MSKTSSYRVKRALISVSDKTGVVGFAKSLNDLGIEILSTGGTAKLLGDAGIEVTEVSDYTGFPEMMDGRVKTLHPRIHGGILARRGTDDAVMQAHDIPGIDLVVVNLYPFESTIAREDCTLDEAIENIDIGGPTMVRASAKNHAHVGIVVNPEDYAVVLDELQNGDCSLTGQTRFLLATRAFEHTARYDGMIANYLGGIVEQSGEQSEAKRVFPSTFNMQFTLAQTMRYGENPHQQAAFYIDPNARSGISNAKQLQGRALSYNNIADTDAALECVRQFSAAPACVIVKHANPCGVATADSLLESYQLAYATDPESAFGGIIAFNRPLDVATAKAIIDQQFVEVIIAPDIEAEAQTVVATKSNVRLLKCAELDELDASLDYKRVSGGLLVQDNDAALYEKLDVVSKRQPSEQEKQDLLFAWQVAKFVKSNAIVYAKDQRTIGVGAGQMSRINSARIAAIKAEHASLQVPGAVMASDAFFPFRDGIDSAAKAGIRAVIQPGGSMRDEEVITAANEADMAMIFTGMRHFRH